MTEVEIKIDPETAKLVERRAKVKEMTIGDYLLFLVELDRKVSLKHIQKS